MGKYCVTFRNLIFLNYHIFSRENLSRTLDSSQVKIELQRQRTPNLKSTIKYYPRGRLEVEVKYDDEGKMLKAKPKEVSEEKEWLEKAVTLLTNS